MQTYKNEEEIEEAFKTQAVININARFEWNDNIDVPDPENEGEEVSVCQYWRVSGLVAKNREAWENYLRVELEIPDDSDAHKQANTILTRWLNNFCPDHPYPINCFVSYENDGDDDADETNTIEGSGTYDVTDL